MKRSSAAPSSRAPALIQVVLCLSACTSWQTAPGSPADLIASEQPAQVRVTRTDSSRIVLQHPSVRGDSIYGSVESADSSLSPKAIPLSDVNSIAIRHSDPTKTTLFITGTAVAAFSALCFGADAFGCGSEDVVAALSATSR